MKGLTLAGALVGVVAISLSSVAQAPTPLPSVWLQSSTPGTAQAGNANVSGVGLFGDKVGIGTSPASARLEVKAAFTGDGARVVGSGAFGPAFSLFDNANDRGGLGLAEQAGQFSTNAAINDLVLRATSGKLILQTGTGAAGLVLSGNGVGIGTANPLYLFDVENVGIAIYAQSTANTAVYGLSSGSTQGLYGENTGGGYGVYGKGTYGVTGSTASGAGNYGLYAYGNIGATGTKSFRIDDPRDPLNRYLLHYCAEGPEPQNIYNGSVRTDNRGYAQVALPDYYEDINRDARVQLTIVDTGDSASFPQVKVVRKVKNGEFAIRSSEPNVEVYWEVKAIRNDPYVRKYGAPVLIDKPANERGKVQQPDLYGMSPEMGQNYDRERADRKKK